MTPNPYPLLSTTPKTPDRCDCLLSVNRCHKASIAGDAESRQILQFLVLRAEELRAAEEATSQMILDLGLEN